MKRAACRLVVFALSLVALDLAVAGLVPASPLPDRATDVQQPATLLAKLDCLRAAPGLKVVLVGDSLVHGGSLEEAGDPNWREHGLAAQLATELSNRPGYRPFVMNLGINGMLPADLERLVPLIIACNVDWVIFDTHLRPFSAEFSPPDRQMARPWLRDLSADADGRIHWRSGTSAGLAGHLADWSAIARHRTLVQENLLSVRAVRRPALRPAAPASETDADVQALVKLAQLKHRLRSLDLDSAGPQVVALGRVLRGLAERGQRHVVFYAKENPALLPDVMDPDVHATRYQTVAGLVRGAQGPTGAFVPPLAELHPEHFIDFTHLTADGYRLLARRLAVEIR